LAPGLKLSTTMRAFSSLDHCRRRAAPVISSIRRTAETFPPLLSSLRLSLMSKPSLMARHYATNRVPPTGGTESPLTFIRSLNDVFRVEGLFVATLAFWAQQILRRLIRKQKRSQLEMVVR
jgi:hypothetical protein